MPDEKTWTLKVTERELTLLRVACLQRLDRLKVVPNAIAEEMQGSYDATRAMMDVGGCLHRPTIEEANLPPR